jgi:hypothetical protein
MSSPSIAQNAAFGTELPIPVGVLKRLRRGLMRLRRRRLSIRAITHGGRNFSFGNRLRNNLFANPINSRVCSLFRSAFASSTSAAAETSRNSGRVFARWSTRCILYKASIGVLSNRRFDKAGPPCVSAVDGSNADLTHLFRACSARLLRSVRQRRL